MSDTMESKRVETETIEVSGDDLISQVKDIVREGNVRRLIIKNEDGHQIVELPLTVGVVGALLAPSLAAVGAIAALVTKCTIEVEREDD